MAIPDLQQGSTAEWPVEDDDRTMVFDGGGVPPDGVPRGHYLEVVRGEEPGTRIPVDSSVEMGRRAQSGFRLSDPEVSGRHCRLWLIQDRVWVADLGSTNGTFIDGERVRGDCVLPPGSVLQVGSHVFRHELLTEAEVDRSEALREDLRAAADYVRSQLPPPWRSGLIRTDWRFVPCAALGGDSFGYDWLPDGRFRIFLLDVSGHGTGPAMHSVSVNHVLTRRTLPDTDFGEPAQVLDALNRTFPMARHADIYFTMWYGIYAPAEGVLTYASGGHPPAFLIPAVHGGGTRLQTPNPGVGLLPDAEFVQDRVEVPAGATLILYSDGAYEFRRGGGREWTEEDLLTAAMAPPNPALTEAHRIHRVVMEAAGRDILDDDLSIVTATIG